MNILDDLNPQQKKAAEHTDGPLLIIAGAGAGKTKTLTYRIINLIQKGVSPQNILAITFTNKAAKEMAKRVESLIQEHVKETSMSGKPFMSTFHALGVSILRESGEVIGVPRHFSILDRSDQTATIKEALKRHSLDPKQHEPKRYIAAISNEKNNLKKAENHQGENSNNFYAQSLARIWKEYEAINKERKALDFDDLITKTALLLKDHPEVLAKYHKRWTHIHVDEYQDTNTAQYLITKLLAGDTKNICVVGDGDQNIYSWRGADMRNILNFEKDYKDAESILLEQNYRSTKTILAVANDIIKKNTVRVDKKLFTENPDGDLIEVYQAYNESDESRYIAEQIETIIENGTPPDNIAILYRANFQSRALEEGLLHRNIPYQVLGVKFFDRKEVKDVLSYIRAARNEDSILDFTRIINNPTRGIGKVTLDKILAGNEHELTPKMLERVTAFREILASIDLKSQDSSTSELIKHVLEVSGMEQAFKESTAPEDEERLENIKELATLATKYDNLPAGEGVDKLLEDAALATDQDSLEKPSSTVKLMTVHASKGLEFPYVFITGLEKDLFPHAAFGGGEATPDKHEEERRLFYVAITRAEKKLYLTHAITRTIFGSQQMNSPSEFFEDIEPEYVESNIPEAPDTGKVVYLDL